MLLAPGDQRERDRAVHHAESEALPADPAEIRDRRAPAALRGENDQDHRSGDPEPHHHHRRGLEASVRDLDEHVRGAPERGEQPDVDHVRAGHRPEATGPPAPSSTTGSADRPPALVCSAPGVIRIVQSPAGSGITGPAS